MLDHPAASVEATLSARPAERLRRIARRRHRVGMVAQVALVSVAVIAAGASIYPLLPRTYSAAASILLHATNQDGATTWNQSVQDALDDNAIQTKIDVLKSRPLQLQVIQQLNLMNDPEYNPALNPSWIRLQAQGIPWLAPWLPLRRSDEGLVADVLVRHLIVKRERKSYLIQVGYESRDPAKAAHMTDILARAFLDDQVSRKLGSHDELLRTLADRVVKLEAKYHADEEAEHNFMVSSGLIHHTEKDMLARQIETLNIGLAEANRKAIETGNRAQALLNQSSRDLDATSDALSSPILQRLRERLVELETGAGTQNVPAGLNQTALRSFQRGIEGETQHIIHAAQFDALVARNNAAMLRESLQQLDKKMVTWQESERKADDLQRAVKMDLEAINASYQRYMQEAGRGDALQPDLELVAFATPPDRPSFPDPILFAAGVLALVILLDGLVLLPRILQHVRQHAE